MRALHFAAVLPLLVLLPACRPDFSLPDAAQISCDDSTPCPDGYVCTPAGRCVDADAYDPTPPALASTPAIAPPIGRAGTTFEIALAAETELARAPVVTLALEAFPEAPCTPGEPGRWTCRWTASGDENDGFGGSVPFDVTLESRAGVVNVLRRAGTLQLDFESPRVASHSLVPALARLGAAVQLFITLSEEPAGPVVLHADVPLDADGTPTQRFEPIREAGTLNWVWTHTVVPGDPEGPVAFTLSATDRAGNASEALELGTVTIDRSPPRLLSPSVSPTHAGRDTVVGASFFLSKAVAAGTQPRVTLGALEFEADPSVTPPEWRFTRTVREGDPEGLLPVIVEAVDDAGHRLVESLGNVAVDFTAPAVVNISATPRLARLGDVVVVSLQPAEPLAGVPTLASNPPLTFVPVPNAHYAWEHVVTAEDGAGTFVLSFRLEDVAGNVALHDGAAFFSLDAEPPELSEVRAVTPRVSARPGHDELVVAFVASKPLDTAPAAVTASVDGRPLACAADEPGGLAWTCTLRLDGTEGSGARRVAILARDAAGNVAFDGTGVTFDFDPPRLVSTSASPRPAKAGDVVGYVVTANEPLAGPPVLTIDGGLELTPTPGTTWNLTRRVTEADGEGEHAVELRLEDDVGNVAQGLAGTPLTFDFTPPALSAFALTPARATAGDTITVTFDAGEELPDAAVTVRLAGRTIACEAGEGTVWSCTHALAADDAAFPDGTETPADVLVQVRDEAGNTAAAGGSVVVDRRAPALVAGASSLVLVAAADNLRTQPGSARPGTTVRLAFTLDEPLRSPPEVRAVREGTTEEVGFTRLSSAGTSWSFTRTVADEADGTWALALRVVDVAGNEATLAFPVTYRVDGTAPPVPAVTAADRIVYTRVPWGSDATGGSPLFHVTGAAEAVEPGARVLVLDGASFGEATELGRGDAGADGSFPRVTLTRADHASVWIAAMDDAGNVSPTARVADGRWVATLGGKQPGSTRENPHAVVAAPSFQNQLDPDSARASEPGAEALASLARVDGAFVEAATEPAWLPHLASGAGPGVRSDARMAWDAARGRVVLFGGIRKGSEYPTDVWEWDGTRWLDRTPAGASPGGRVGHVLVWDAHRRRTVLYGGVRWLGSVVYRDLWEWDGTSWTPRTFPADAWPGGHVGGTATYDFGAGRILVYGGSPRSGAANTLWAYDGAAWTNLGGGPVLAGARLGMDADGGIVLSGEGITSGALETWKAFSQWVQLAAAPNTPPAGVSELVFDLARQRLVAFENGGAVWTLANDAWTRTAAVGPRARFEAATANGPSGPLLFGGGLGGDGGELSELWQWTGTWTELTPSGDAPPLVAHGAMTYDETNRRLVHFGGEDETSTSGATWLHDGRRWRGVAAGPGERRSHTLVWDGVHGLSAVPGLSLLYGGLGSGTEFAVFDGTTWFDLASIYPGPAKRHGHAAAFDPGRGEMVIVGGWVDGVGATDETWLWSAAGWRQAAPASSPEARINAAMAWDPDRRVGVLFGGYSHARESLLGDTWEWNGAAWTRRSPAHAPLPREGGQAVWDASRRRVVLVGGNGTLSSGLSGGHADVWEWDGTDWVERTPPRLAHRGGAYPALAYDPDRRSVVLTGGAGLPAFPGDTWDLSDDADLRPTLRLAFDWATSGIPASAIVDATLTATASGQGAGVGGAGGGAPIPGLLLAGWDARLGAWTTNAQSTTAGFSALRWSAGSGNAVRRRLVSGESIHALLLTRGGQGNAPAPATARLDYVELEVKYRQ